MICQRAGQDEALGAGCVCVCGERFLCTQMLSVECVCARVPTHTELHCQLALGLGACSSFASTGPLDLSAWDCDLFTCACSRAGAKGSLCQDYPIA